MSSQPAQGITADPGKGTPVRPIHVVSLNPLKN
jgi:hypothetical protein